MITLKIIFSMLCLMGIGLLVYSRYTSKPKRAKISIRSAFTLLSSWAVFTLIETLTFVETTGTSFLVVFTFAVASLNVVFYIGVMILSFFGYFDKENFD